MDSGGDIAGKISVSLTNDLLGYFVCHLMIAIRVGNIQPGQLADRKSDIHLVQFETKNADEIVPHASQMPDITIMHHVIVIS